MGYTHEATVAIRATDPTSVLPGLHMVASLLKRWLIGTLHYGIDAKQLPYYLDEFTFRFNRRDSRSRGLLFYRLLQQAVATEPHPLHDLVAGTQNPIHEIKESGRLDEKRSRAMPTRKRLPPLLGTKASSSAVDRIRSS